MPAEGRENPLLKKGNSDAFFREKYLTKNRDCGNSMVRRSNYWKKDGCSCYICSGYNRRGDCSRHLISEEDLDEAIRLHLQEYVASLSNAAAIAKSIEFLETGYEE